MAVTSAAANTGSSPTSTVSSLPDISTVSSSSPSAALVLLLPLFTSNTASVPAEARSAMAVRPAVIRFLILLLPWFGLLSGLA